MSHAAVRTHRARPPLSFVAALLVCVLPARLQAQNYRLDLPWPSPHATVSQVVGLTTLSVDYHRPGVNKRVIWGGLVPWDTVWRAGANENTVLSSTSAFSVGGATLPAGRYGVFMIPGRERWTVILSRQANAWGAFSYDPAEDAVRLTAVPRASEFTERLAYTFDDLVETGVTLTLKWEKLALSVPIVVATDVVVLDSLRSQLRNLPRFWGTAWEQAAAWALDNTTNLDLAETWADTAVALAPTFASYNLKAAILDRRGLKAQADSLRQAHLASATEAQLNAYGYQLLNQKRNAEALAIFIRNTEAHPRSWNAWDSLGEAYAVTGDTSKAAANYRKALALATDPVQRKRIEAVLAGLK
jgi:tetratricopeptide (TPR) repeat protein